MNEENACINLKCIVLAQDDDEYCRKIRCCYLPHRQRLLARQKDEGRMAKAREVGSWSGT